MTKEKKKQELQELTVKQLKLLSKLKEAKTPNEEIIIAVDIAMIETQKQVIISQVIQKTIKTMKASELRIGNYVAYKHVSHVEQINTISFDPNKNKYMLSTQIFPPFTLDDAEPVPLTEEELLRFGFEELGYINERHFASPCGKLIYILDYGFLMFNRAVLAEIKYVHEFQNACHLPIGELTRKELTTK